MSSLSADKDSRSDNACVAADTAPEIVMAEQITHDVVKQAQSMGSPAPIDDPATTTCLPAGDGDAPSDTPNSNPKLFDTPSVSTVNAASTDADRVDSASVIGADGGDALTAASIEPSENQQHEAIPTETKEHLVNGDAGENSASEDVSSQQALGDVSGGSDTDISRPGSVDPAKEGAGRHLRSNSTSVKKPTSFKSVSVTKNFLAKSAVSAPAVRVGEKASPAGQASTAAQQTARPRLVAKSGTGSGGLQRSGLSKLNGAGSGPDASKVWNKNQPVPPPPPKQFTDEELKQQYGIHLATRLPADEAGKEAKWADIDDDEDDWAPDTVQWMDGTKSTVAAAGESLPPPADDATPTTNEPEVEAVKPLPVTTSQRPSSTTGTKTILKPGTHSQTATRPGLASKGQSDKPTLVAKPSAAAPVKSPWATLPPVEKVPPVQINPPAQPLPTRYSQQDPRGYDSFPPASQPAKEIAPDDFNRSWRDDRGNRELFNSHSGRYEPVHETRRGSVRDHGFRQQPSVLQRPSHDGPAEPSAAFQTSRTSADGPAWGRRRNSSNVSAGSGRRMSIDRRGPEPPNMPLNVQRRGSQSINGSDGAAPGTPRPHFAQKAGYPETFHAVPEQPGSWVQKSSPNLAQAQPVSPYGSVDSAAAQDVAVQESPAPVESAVEVQNRLMREKIERARLAKQKQREQEEKEEAERKERIRKKLEAMGMTNDAKTKSKDQPQPSARALEKSPLKDKAVPAPVQSPPKPPVPTSEGEVAQYGMMKVHQPQPVKKAYPEPTAQKLSTRGAETTPKPSPSPVKVLSEPQTNAALSTTEATLQPLSNLGHEGRLGKPQSESSQAQLQHTEAASQALKPSADPQAAWSSNLPQQPRSWTSNVWGPPKAKDRALGNGTFEPSFNRGQPTPTAPQLPSQGPTTQASSIGSQGPLKSSSQQSQGISPPFAQKAMYSKTESLPNQQTNAGSSHPPGPIGPPAEKPSWNNFAAAIRRDDQALVQKARQDLERFGGETYRPEFRETYTDQQGKTQRTLHQRIGGNSALTNGQISADNSKLNAVSDLKTKEDVSKPVFPTSSSTTEGTSQTHLPLPSQSGRSSRFFPRPSETNQQTTTTSNIYDSPPPPETQSHPAFTGDTHHPVVKMPKPSPRVRLPPSTTEVVVTSDAPVTMPHRVRVGLGARPLALDPEWQARFNSLLDKSTPAGAPVGKGPSPIQPPAHVRPGSLAIAASSKAPLEVRANLASATVSLPSAIAKKIFAEDDSSDVVTRTSAEEMLLEEREFGSLPIVRVSKVPHLAANEPPIGFPNTRPNSRFHKPMDVTTKVGLNILDSDAETIDVIIRLANMKEPVTKSITRKRGRKNFNPKPKRNFTPGNGSSSSSQNSRSRKPSNYQGQGSNSQNTSRQSSGGNGWGNNNGNNRTTTPNNASWARRTAPVVH